MSSRIRRSRSARPVHAGGAKLGTVADIAPVERQALARHTNDNGDNVAIEVHPAPGVAALMRILFVGDVVGRPGRERVEDRCRRSATELDVDVCVVNGENAADGVGITPRLAEQLLAAGADAITLGNHTGGGGDRALPRHLRARRPAGELRRRAPPAAASRSSPPQTERRSP